LAGQPSTVEAAVFGSALENAGDTPASTAESSPAFIEMERVLRLVAETLLVATLLHALAALVLGNFRFASFFERAHSGFQIREPGFNHLIRHVATQFFAAASSAHAKATSNA